MSEVAVIENEAPVEAVQSTKPEAPVQSGAAEAVPEPEGASGPAAEPMRCESPPAAAMPVREEVDPRTRLHQLAAELARTHNRRLVLEYLALRRAVR